MELYVQPVGPRWAGMILPDEAAPPEPGELKGAVLFADNAELAEAWAAVFLGKSLAQT